LVRVEKQGSENKIEYLQGKPVYRLRGNLLPLIELKQILDIHEDFSEDHDVTNIVVLNAETQCFGLIVHEIQDTADIVVKPLSRFLKFLSVYSGATLLGDGSIALILDVVGIAQHQKLLSDRKNDPAKKELSTADGRPKTYDTQEFLLFRLNSPTKHALFLGYVHRLEEFKRSAIEYSVLQRVIRYRNSILPIISLNECLGFPLLEEQKTSEIIPVIVIQRGDHFYGLEVNEILDVLSTEAKIEDLLAGGPAILGSLVTESEVVVVIDPQPVISKLLKKSNDSFPVSNPPSVASGLVPNGKSLLLNSEQTYQELEAITRASLKSAQTYGKILFVEDTAFFRKYVSGVLKKGGYHVTIVPDGQEALNLLEKTEPEEFNVILSDIEMPKVNGLQLARAIKIHPKWKNTALIALTTKGERKNVEEGLRAGFDIYLEKVNPPELLNAIYSVISKKRKIA
jgi:two-component system chemotaxis sensor kinase CheA